MTSLTISSITDIGNSRKKNEDYYGNFDLSTGATISNTSPLEVGPLGIGIFMSDGMGGAKGGEVASKMAIDSISNFLIENTPSRELLDSEIADLFSEAISNCHDQIIDKSYLELDLAGMGATFSGCLFFRSSLWIGHIGDSRIYRFRNNQLTQLTNDHSPVGRLVRAGKIKPEDARFHPNNHLLDQALGANINLISPEIIEEEFETGDRFLICTDGLHDSLGDDQIAKVISSSENDSSCLDTLVKQAKVLKGNDNITITLIEIA